MTHQGSTANPAPANVPHKDASPPARTGPLAHDTTPVGDSPFLAPDCVLGEIGRRDLLNTLDAAAIVSVTTPDGTIVEANRQFCRISGYERHEIVGQNHRIVNSGVHSREFWSEMYRTVAAGGVWRAEVCNRAKDGSLYWVDSTMRGFFGPDGKLRHIVSVRNDITELKRTLAELGEARDQARSALQTKSEFLANMSHELRTPLTAVLGFADLLLEQGEASKAPLTRLDFLQTIRRSGRHLMSVINDILDISKIEAGRMDVEAVACSPEAMLNEVRTMLEPRALAKGLSFHTALDGPVPPWVLTDPTRLRQIILNLVGNAVKFTSAGVVRVTARYRDVGSEQFLELDVEDSGQGIPPEVAEKLFEPFSQGDTSMSRRFGGSGLGLTISRRLAQMLGGGVELIRSAPNAGSHFRCTIKAPSAPAPAATPGTVDPARFPAPSQQVTSLSGRILLAEDGADNQRLISFILRKAGASVISVTDGAQAIDAALSAKRLNQPFDLILMDMQMPELDGYTATTRLRAAGYDGPIIALTAHAMSEDRDRCLRAGCDEYATKPIDKPHLLELCRTWISRPSARAAA